MVGIAAIKGEAKKQNLTSKMSNVETFQYTKCVHLPLLFLKPGLNFSAGDWHLWYFLSLQMEFMLNTL